MSGLLSSNVCVVNFRSVDFSLHRLSVYGCELLYLRLKNLPENLAYENTNRSYLATIFLSQIQNET